MQEQAGCAHFSVAISHLLEPFTLALGSNGPAFTRDGAAKARLRYEEAGTARALVVLILPTFRVAGGKLCRVRTLSLTDELPTASALQLASIMHLSR